MYEFFHAFYKFNQVFLIIKRNFSWFQMRIQSNNWIGFSKYYSRHFVFSDYIVFLNFLSSTKSKGFLKLSLIWFSLQTPAKKKKKKWDRGLSGGMPTEDFPILKSIKIWKIIHGGFLSKMKCSFLPRGCHSLLFYWGREPLYYCSFNSKFESVQIPLFWEISHDGTDN